MKVQNQEKNDNESQRQSSSSSTHRLGTARTLHFPHWKGSQKIKDYDQPRQSSIDQYFINNGYQILNFKQLTNAGHQYDLVDLTSRKRYIAKHFNYEMQFDDELSIVHKIDQLAKKNRLKVDLKDYINYNLKSNDEHFIIFYEQGACNLAEFSQEQSKNGVYWFNIEKQLYHLLFTLNKTMQIMFQYGIYHGNIKPENIIMVNSDQELGKLQYKFIDFGLAQTKTYKILGGRTDEYTMEIELEENQLIQDYEFKEEKDRQQFEYYALGRSILHLMLDSVEAFEKQRHKNFEIIGQQYILDVNFMPNTVSNNKNIIKKLQNYYSKDLLDFINLLVVERDAEKFNKNVADSKNKQEFTVEPIYDHQNWAFDVLETCLNNREQYKIETEQDFIKELELTNSLRLYRRTLHLIKEQKKKPQFNIKQPQIIYNKLIALFELKYYRKLKMYANSVKEEIENISDRSSDIYWQVQYILQKTIYENVGSSGLALFLKSYVAYFSDIYGENSFQYHQTLINVCNMYISYIPSVIYATKLGPEIQQEIRNIGQILLSVQTEDFQQLEVKRHVKNSQIDNFEGEEFNPIVYAYAQLFAVYGKGVYNFTDRASDFKENIINMQLAIEALQKWSLEKLNLYSELMYISQLYNCIYQTQLHTERETMLDQLKKEQNLLLNIHKSMGSGNFLHHFTLASNLCTIIKYTNYSGKPKKIQEIRERILEIFWAQEEANFIITDLTKPIFKEFGEIIKEFWENNFPEEKFTDLKLYFLQQMRNQFQKGNFQKAKSYLLITERFLDLMTMLDTDSQKEAKQVQKWLEKIYYFLEFRRQYERCKINQDIETMESLVNKFKLNLMKNLKLPNQKMQEEQFFPFYLFVLFKSFLEISKLKDDYKLILNEYYLMNKTVSQLRTQFQEQYQVYFTYIDIFQAYAHHQLGEYEVSVFFIDEAKKQVNQNSVIQQNKKCRLRLPKKQIDQSNKEYSEQGLNLVAEWYSKTKIFILN